MTRVIINAVFDNRPEEQNIEEIWIQNKI
jgi:hypothetical protein